MKLDLEEPKRNHKVFWNRRRLNELAVVSALFLASMFVQHYADIYVVQVAGSPVGDLFLNNLPVINLDIFVVQGALLVTLVGLIALAWKPRYIIFTLAAFALFITVRSFFISLTHVGVNPRIITLDSDNIGFGLYNLLYNTKSDFFFSGHTGAPFLMGLIFREERWLSIFFFIVSFVFGASVLLGRIHYSIDVFAAPFMTFGIYSITKRAFPRAFSYIRTGHHIPPG